MRVFTALGGAIKSNTAATSGATSARTKSPWPVQEPIQTPVFLKARTTAACLMALAASAALPTERAHATEVGLFAGPLGGADIRSAYLPPTTGLYVTGIGIAGSYNVLRDDNGNSSPINAYYNGLLGGIAGMYVYPWTLGGGSLASTVNQGYLYTNERIASRHQTDSGFTDTYSDLLIWSKYIGPLGEPSVPADADAPKLPYGLTVAGAYSMVFPDGRYKVKDLATQGHNYYVLIPNFALTYLTGPQFSFGRGTEFSARLFYDVPTKNDANGYQSGQVVDVDWAVTERFTGFQAGVAGNYAHQTTPDQLHGADVAPHGNYLVRATAGPVVAFDIPSLKATVKAKILADYYDRNTFGDRITGTVTLSFKLF